MNRQDIRKLINDLESCKKIHETYGIEYWFARDIQNLLGYSDWRNFINVIDKAKQSCINSQREIKEHFLDKKTEVIIGSGAIKKQDNIMFTRYACYLIAQNGDPKKEQVAFAQTYFALQTRKLEIIEQAIIDGERVAARNKLKSTEKELSEVVFQVTNSSKSIAKIRSKGDKALFNKTTGEMKSLLGIKQQQPLADFIHPLLLRAKDFANGITIFNTKIKRFDTESKISKEHEDNNRSVRKTLIDRGIKPEELPSEPPIQEIEKNIKNINDNDQIVKNLKDGFDRQQKE